MDNKSVIAHIHPHYLPISETFIHRFVSGIATYRCVVLTERVQNELIYGFDNQYTVYNLERQQQRVDKLIAKVYRPGRTSQQQYTAQHVKYSRQLSQSKAKLIHAHFGHVGWFCLPLSVRHELPLVVSFHGADATSIARQSIWGERYSKLFDLADIITAPSRYIADRLVALGCHTSKVEVVHYGLDLDCWQPVNACNGTRGMVVDSTSVDILMITRLAEKKGVSYGVLAVASLAARHGNVRLRIVGDGPLRKDIEDLVAQLGMSQQVELLGAVPNTEVRHLLAQSDMLLAPSVTATDGDTEGLPVAIIEAAATGLPVVATVHAGIPEIVRDSVSGFLVPERDSTALAQRLEQLIDDKQLRIQMGRAGRRIVETKFDIRDSVMHLERLYVMLL